MRDREAVESLAKLSASGATIDLLINNAGLAPPMSGLHDSDWDKIETRSTPTSPGSSR